VQRKSRRWPSPALVIALVAFFAALSGAALAGPVHKLLTKGKVVQIADQEIAGKAPGLSVSHASTAGNADRAGTATSADRAGSAVNADRAKDADQAAFADNSGGVDGKDDFELQPFAAGDSGDGCDPSSSTFVTCESVTMGVPANSQIVLIGDVGWFTASGSNSGVCRLTADGSQVGDVALPGLNAGLTDTTHQLGAGLNAIAGPLSFGSHTFALQCNQTQGDISFPGAWLSAIKVGGGS
jgi:hypothetical protein